MIMVLQGHATIIMMARLCCYNYGVARPCFHNYGVARLGYHNYDGKAMLP